MSVFRSEKIWRILTNIWTLVTIAVIVLNFFAKNGYEFLIGPTTVIYTAVLSLYVTTKEFDRWYEFHDGRHPGEWFVIGWTAVILILLALYFALGPEYKLSAESVATYLVVLSVFALTQKSKQLHEQKARQKKPS